MGKLICWLRRSHRFGKMWRFGPTHAREKTCLRCGFIMGHGSILSGGWHPNEEIY